MDRDVGVDHPQRRRHRSRRDATRRTGACPPASRRWWRPQGCRRGTATARPGRVRRAMRHVRPPGRRSRTSSTSSRTARPARAAEAWPPPRPPRSRSRSPDPARTSRRSRRTSARRTAPPRRSPPPTGPRPGRRRRRARRTRTPGPRAAVPATGSPGGRAGSRSAPTDTASAPVHERPPDRPGTADARRRGPPTAEATIDLVSEPIPNRVDGVTGLRGSHVCDAAVRRDRLSVPEHPERRPGNTMRRRVPLEKDGKRTLIHGPSVVRGERSRAALTERTETVRVQAAIDRRLGAVCRREPPFGGHCRP